MASGRGIKTIGTILDVLAGVTSCVCIVALVVYYGYNLSALDATRTVGVMRASIIIYTVNIVYHLLFMFRSTVREARIIKWIVDGAVIMVMAAWLVPDTSGGADTIGAALRSRTILYIVLLGYSGVEICFGLSRIPGRRTNPAVIMAMSFLLFIIAGTFVLMLPRSTYHGITFFDALLTASSAVSITGLTSVDIPSTFTTGGILVISVLIQLGSLGIITFTSFFAMYFAGSTSIYNQLLLKDVIYSKGMNALVPTLLQVMGFTLMIEIAGAALVYATFPAALCPDTESRILTAAFHSMSSFCNAGFSVVPGGLSNPLFMQAGQKVYIVTIALVFAGSVGFPLLINFKETMGWHIRMLAHRITHHGHKPATRQKLDLNSKLVLTVTLTVLAIGSTAFLILESDNTLRGMTLYEKCVQSVFNSIVPRSAGFASVNPANFLDLTLLLVMVQMVIGGASQSMAGGIKVNTLGTILLNTRAVVHGHAGATAFHRTVSLASVRRANAVIVTCGIALVSYLAVMLALEPTLGTRNVIFETVSALFTVGSSLGITGSLGDASKVVLSTAMFLGRVGILSLLSGLMASHDDLSEHFPTENIIIN